jgi:hypothetical protein
MNPDPILEFISIDANVEKVIASSIAFLKYKEKGYKEKTPEKELALLSEEKEYFTKLISSGIRMPESVAGEDTALVESIQEKSGTAILENMKKKWIDTATALSRFRRRTDILKKHINDLCTQYSNNKPALINKFRTKITEAITYLREEVSGDSGEVALTRGKIEKILIDFANSWESFKNSYSLNIALLGGPGTGKTTMAKAIAKCFNAYGILATDTINSPEKTELIARYVGQTAPMVYNVLYDSLESVCFIDEAYSIGGTAVFGQEFIDALVEFTQRFPGYTSIIVAGYKKDMKRDFFEKNEGLYRRFPTQFELLPYPVKEIKKAFIDRISKKKGYNPDEKETAIEALKYHLLLLDLLYFDTNAADFDNCLETLYTFNDYIFNLEPIIRLIYLTNNKKKRDVLKTYILLFKLKIKEGDIFPNQMGDVQTLIEKTLTQKFILDGTAVSLDDAIQLFNDFLSTKSNHKVWFSDSHRADKKMISFTTNGLNPKEFNENIISPLINTIFGAQKIFGEISINAELSYRVNDIYTESIANFVNMIDENKTLPYSLDQDFINQEFERLKRIRQSGQKLNYFDLSVIETESDTLNTITLGGPFDPKKVSNVSQACSEIALQKHRVTEVRDSYVPQLRPTNPQLRPKISRLGQPLIVKSLSTTPPPPSSLISKYSGSSDVGSLTKYKYRLYKDGVVKPIIGCQLIYHNSKVYLGAYDDLGAEIVSLDFLFTPGITLYFSKSSEKERIFFYELYYPTLELSPTRGGDAIKDAGTDVIYDFYVKDVAKHTLGGSRKTRKLKRK